MVKGSAEAIVYANRCPSLRAIVGTCLESVDQGIAAVAANVLVLEYPYKSLSQIRNMLSRFARGREEFIGPNAAAVAGDDFMRIGKVIGRVTLQKMYDTLVGGRFLLVEVQDRFSLVGKQRKNAESLVVYDEWAQAEGDLIAFTESREAAMPFYPEKRVPLDAYNAAILDAAVVSLEI